MKKFFSILAAVLFAGSMMADSYTVTFKDAGEGKGDSSSSLTSSNVADYVAEGAEYFSAVAPTGKVYLGQGGYGLKFGNSSGAGSITLTLVTPVTPTSIVMNASPWSATEGEGLLQDSIFATKSTGAKGTFADFTYYYDGATQVTTIVVGTNTKRGYVKSITVNYEGGVTPPAVATPVISGEAEFTESTTVTITCSTEGVVLYYTLDGTEPNNNATAYNAPFSLTETATVKAIAYEQNGDQYSAVASKTFTKATPLPDPTNCAEAREAALSVSGNNVEYKGGQVYTIEGYVTAIQTAYSATNHNITFWMADTEDGGNVLEAYRAACASEEDAPAVGDKVAVTGKLTKYNTTPEFAAGCTFVITEKSAPATNLGEKTIAEFLTMKNTKDTCIITGVVDSIKNTQYGNLYISDATAQVYVYGVLTPAGESKKFADLGVEEGDTLTVLAIYNEYQGAPQVSNAIFVSVKKAQVVEPNPDEEAEVVYDWAGNIGTTILGATGVEISTVKIHNNTDVVDCIKFGSSYVYADGKYIAIKPAEGAFKAGDTIKTAVCFNNSDDTKYCMVDVYAADGATRIWHTDSATTINGRTSAADPAIQEYILKADQDSLFLGRLGNTTMFITLLQVVRPSDPALADPTNCAEAREAALSVSANNELYNDGKEYTIEGYVTAIQTAYSATNHNITFWMADTEDGGNVLEAYRAACASEEDAPAVGDKVAVTGKLTKYNTTPEFAAGCTFVITEKSAPATNLGEKTIAEFLELKNAKDTCILTGVVSNIQNEEYGNFDLVDETGSVYIYGLLTPEGEAKKFADLGVEAGDTLTVLAIYSEYNGTPQVKNAIFVDLVKGEGGGSEGEYSYDYEPGEVSTFNVEMTVAEMSDYTEDYGVVAIYFESEDGSYFASMELIISSADLVVPGAYQISDSEEEGTFYASPGGDEQYDYGCYFGVTYIDPEDGEEYYNPYYLVSGNVTITETGIQVQAKSYYGSTVNFTYEDKNDAVVNTKLTDKLLKAIENGNVIIKSGNVIFNVNGQRIK